MRPAASSTPATAVQVTTSKPSSSSSRLRAARTRLLSSARTTRGRDPGARDPEGEGGGASRANPLGGGQARPGALDTVTTAGSSGTLARGGRDGDPGNGLGHRTGTGAADPAPDGGQEPERGHDDQGKHHAPADT